MHDDTVQQRLQQALGTAYVIDRELGGGGMSRVFVADDVALGRKVVVKLLRTDVAEALSAERFKREVKLAARLQHPHIVPLLTAAAGDGDALYYMMPFVQGESLRERLDREGALPIADTISIMSDVANALAYAHRAGVVHRDVKPDNILLTDGGAVVTDFGIAKAISASHADGNGAARGSSTLTAAGTSLGTPAYIAPEQAAGDAVDHRADLYALGVVAYEMLAGRPPFEGRTAQQLLAAHATQPPEPIMRRRSAVPPALGALVMQLLEKNPADRPQSAEDVRRGVRAPARAAVTTRHHLPWILLPVAAIALVLSGVFLARRGSSARNRPLVVAAITAPPGHELQPSNNAAFTPDGKRLAFVASDGQGRNSIWIRALDSTRAVRIARTDGAIWPFWAPDGQSLGFFADGQLKIVDLRGGAPRALCPVSYAISGTWTKDGIIVYAPVLFGPLYRVAATGGPCTPVTQLRPGEVDHRRPSALPDGRVLFSSLRANVALVLDVATGQVTEVRRPGRDAQFVPPDWMLYFDESNGPLYAQRLDMKTLKPVGEPRIVVDNISTINGYFGRFAASSSALLFEPAPTYGTAQLVWVDRRSVVLDSVPTPVEALTFAPSRDGKRIVIGGYGMTLVDRERGVATRLQLSSPNGQGTMDPAWDPTDSLIAYRTSFVGINTLRVYHLATGQSDSVFAARGRVPFRPSWSPNGDEIAFTLRSGEVGSYEEPWIYSFVEKRARRAWEPKGNTASPAWSPDGRWIAYESDETGAFEVYVRTIGGLDAPLRVSSSGGQVPRWRADGRALFYRAPDGSIMEVAVTGSRTLQLSRPRVAVVGAPFSFAAANRSFAVSADGEQFIAFARGDAPVFTLLLDWQERLRER